MTDDSGVSSVSVVRERLTVNAPVLTESSIVRTDTVCVSSKLPVVNVAGVPDKMDTSPVDWDVTTTVTLDEGWLWRRIDRVPTVTRSSSERDVGETRSKGVDARPVPAGMAVLAFPAASVDMLVVTLRNVSVKSVASPTVLINTFASVVLSSMVISALAAPSVVTIESIRVWEMAALVDEP